MKTKTKMIVLAVAMFVIGIVATCMFIRTFIYPNFMNDPAKGVAKFGYESAIEGYKCGQSDGAHAIHRTRRRFFVIFNDHSRLAGQHAFLGASKYHWINYDEKK